MRALFVRLLQEGRSRELHLEGNLRAGTTIKKARRNGLRTKFSRREARQWEEATAIVARFFVPGKEVS